MHPPLTCSTGAQHRRRVATLAATLTIKRSTLIHSVTMNKLLHTYSAKQLQER
ncbi:hypothetical protein XBLMG947_0549 [Xanthomonas bromi]|uniref:Uncharacterized protein n=1 Tax=Xanthomonas bromi TaxID=56449 RepID=A0A1C3NH93_9XANT|nr:hypothetical protein XBLMG947_0549 [Xanthomonas bromi]